MGGTEAKVWDGEEAVVERVYIEGRWPGLIEAHDGQSMSTFYAAFKIFCTSFFLFFK